MALFARLKSLKRDFDAIASTLSGRGAAATATAFATREAPAPSQVATRKLRVATIVRETSDAVSLVFEDPSGAPIPFAAGQFFTLHVPVGGEVLKRAYSASSSALNPGRVSVTVKRVADGRVSRHIVANVREGETFDVLGPSGLFTPAPATESRVLVLIGGGSGVTPLASIARTFLASEPGTRIALVYGNRAADHIIFRDTFDALAAEYGGDVPRFVVRHVLEEPPAGWTGGAGRLNRAALARELDGLGVLGDLGAAEYFLCGPEPMMAEARACLEGRAVPPGRIREEKFVSAHASSAPLAAQEVTVLLRKVPRKVLVSPGHTVLESALDAGVEMPFSCAVGGCGTCRVRLTQGSVVMDEPNCLSPDERAQGYVLACVSRPTSPCTLEVP